MRTTLAIDDDVLAAARERARREGRPIGAVISDLARQALTGSSGTAESEAEGTPRHTGPFRPFPSRGRVVSNELIDALREQEGV
ncbi:hypothetical protein [Aquipuribacter nitratireducens]|uniref:Antitoxin VapB39 n=1 Tax=Aquipuribacter nitratireducens TaxID=650104 RepID=A0ABW0GLP1_9MICO